jgi:hypothetical protein
MLAGVDPEGARPKWSFLSRSGKFALYGNPFN